MPALRAAAGGLLLMLALTSCTASKRTGAAANFVRVELRDGVYWFVHGTNRFLSLGVNAIVPVDKNPFSDSAPYGPAYDGLSRFGGNLEAWSAEVGHRLQAWSFNTVGAWSHPILYERLPIYHTRLIPFGAWRGTNDVRLTDVWSPEYATDIAALADRELPPHRNDSHLIGYFANNELPWYGDRGWPTDPRVSLLSRYMELPADAPGKGQLLAFLREFYHGSVDAFSSEWAVEGAGFEALAAPATIHPRAPRAAVAVAAWAGRVAEEYYRLCAEAIRRADPNHLFLGSRLAGPTFAAVLKACARHADVVSINHYAKSGVFDAEMMRAISAACNKPLLITEYSWRAMENNSGLRNTHGADVTVATQADRAESFQRYALAALSEPFLLGLHWFTFADQPPGGRFDGEDSNYGLLDIHDRPYATLLDTITKFNRAASRIHESSRIALPAERPELLADYRPVRVRGLETSLAEARTFSPGRTAFELWSDQKGGSTVAAEPAAERLVLECNSGSGWGGGVSLPLDSATDLLGARQLFVRLQAPAGLRFIVGLNETGAERVGQQTYAGRGHADGESYNALELMAEAGREEYAVALEDLVVNPNFGNQRGNHTLDLDALREVSVFVPGPQPPVRLELESIRFE